MPLLIVSFIAGLLTVLAPCILPVLPLILGGSVVDNNKWRPLIITASLAVSVVFFTLILKASTLFIMIPQSAWEKVSGGIILLFGIFTLFPRLWDRIAGAFGLGTKSETLLSSAGSKKNVWGTILVGAALGPVFASCSPTYFVILATVLPVSFVKGIAYLSVYALGLMLSLLVIAVLGQKAIAKIRWAADPEGWFKKGLGLFFIILAIAIMTGYEKKLELYLLDQGLFDVTKIEQGLLEKLEDMPEAPVSSSTSDQSDQTALPILGVAPEITGIESWINSSGETLADLKGKVVMVDFWTYSCINCIRTLPYLSAWHDAYQDDGLVIIGVHAPEFAFERIGTNVENAVQKYNIKYPVALDNDFSTWRAYENHYWPAKYLIDKAGNIRYKHFGEGKYEETEEVIRQLLEEGSAPLSKAEVIHNDAGSQNSKPLTPETYLGHARATNFGNEAELKLEQDSSYNLLSTLTANQWSLGGLWKIENENIIAGADGARLKLKFNAKDVFLVMGADQDAWVQVLLNGKNTVEANSGADVAANSVVIVNDFRLYRLVELEQYSTNNTLELIFPKGVMAYAFTFGG